MILIVFLTFSLLAASIYQLNFYTREVYSVKNQENKLNQLSQEIKTLEISFSSANSLANIGTYLQNQTFEKVSRVEYIQILGDTALAK